MTYNWLLDTWFTYSLLSLGVPLALFGAGILLASRKHGKRKSRWPIALLIGGGIVLSFVKVLINPMYLGYGQSFAVTQIHYANGKVFVIDYIKTGGTQRSLEPAPYYRIHVLDAASGKKIRRLLIGQGGEFLTSAGDSVGVAYYNDISYFSLLSGRKKFTWSASTLPRMYPQLAMGVDHIAWADAKRTLDVFTTDGSQWKLNTSTGKLYPAGEYPADTLKHWYISDQEIRSGEAPLGLPVLRLGYMENNPQKRYLCDKTGKPLNSQTPFLEGRPVALYAADSSLVVLHYETTQKEKFILTAIAADGAKILWELRHSSLRPDYSFPKNREPGITYDETGGILFFNIGKEIYAIRLHDGVQLWKQIL